MLTTFCMREREARRAMPLVLPLLLLPLLLLAAAPHTADAQQQSFPACVGANAAGATLRDPSQPDFNFRLTRSLFPSPTPSYIVDVSSAQHVAAVLLCAARSGLKVCPRSGGHSFIGLSSCSGVMIDLRNMNTRVYDPASQRVTVGLGSTLGEMFNTVYSASGGSRMVGVGLCPSVGTGGYLLGGGHNPYGGVIGITCESLINLEVVLANGQIVNVSPTENPELFWASCGGGGGHFGVATRAVLNTHDAAVFNNNVFFRFSWPLSNAGRLFSLWTDFNQDNGNTWLRLEVDGGSSVVYGYGVCWDASSADACVGRLSQAPFFNLPGRQTQLLYKSSRVADFQKFIGPAGDWANNVVSISDQAALDNQVYLDANNGTRRVYSSAFWKYPPQNKPSVDTFQSMANMCAGADMSRVTWLSCQFNPWAGAQKYSSMANRTSFAHHSMDGFLEFIGHSTNPGGIDNINSIRDAIRRLMRPFFAGLYVNYPEFGYSLNDYSYLYWGQSFQRLATLRSQLDPTQLFGGAQQLPLGPVGCPGSLIATPAGNTASGAVRNVRIAGYEMGQLIGMSASWTLSPGCVVVAVSGAQFSVNGNVYTAVMDSALPLQATVQRTSGSGGSDSCQFVTTAINGISC
jgi:FAD/FMN-containing dehydrogenase